MSEPLERAGMICVYRGTSATDAFLVSHWLERNGVPARIQGQSLLSLRGEIPIGEAWPSVWVARVDRERAEVAIRDFQAPKLVHPAWHCGCGEENPPSFGSCWQCGADAP